MRCKEKYKTRLEEEMINGKLRASWLALAIVGKRACCAIMLQVDTQVLFFYTRSYAALRAADLDWIVGPGYSSGRYILETNHEKP